jgi:hypothetical protein
MIFAINTTKRGGTAIAMEDQLNTRVRAQSAANASGGIVAEMKGGCKR